MMKVVWAGLSTNSISKPSKQSLQINQLKKLRAKMFNKFWKSIKKKKKKSATIKERTISDKSEHPSFSGWFMNTAKILMSSTRSLDRG